MIARGDFAGIEAEPTTAARDFIRPCKECRALGYVPRSDAPGAPKDKFADCLHCKGLGWTTNVDAAEPTPFPKGGVGRMAIYQIRYAQGLPLWNPADSVEFPRPDSLCGRETVALLGGFEDRRKELLQIAAGKLPDEIQAPALDLELIVPTTLPPPAAPADDDDQDFDDEWGEPEV